MLLSDWQGFSAPGSTSSHRLSPLSAQSNYAGDGPARVTLAPWAWGGWVFLMATTSSWAWGTEQGFASTERVSLTLHTGPSSGPPCFPGSRPPA